MITCWSTSQITAATGNPQSRVSQVFHYSTNLGSRLWKGWCAARAMALNGLWDVTSGKKGTGRGHKYNRDDFAQAVGKLPHMTR